MPIGGALLAPALGALGIGETAASVISPILVGAGFGGALGGLFGGGGADIGVSPGAAAGTSGVGATPVATPGAAPGVVPGPGAVSGNLGEGDWLSPRGGGIGAAAAAPSDVGVGGSSVGNVAPAGGGPTVSGGIGGLSPWGGGGGSGGSAVSGSVAGLSPL